MTLQIYSSVKDYNEVVNSYVEEKYGRSAKLLKKYTSTHQVKKSKDFTAAEMNDITSDAYNDLEYPEEL